MICTTEGGSISGLTVRSSFGISEEANIILAEWRTL